MIICSIVAIVSCHYAFKYLFHFWYLVLVKTYNNLALQVTYHAANKTLKLHVKCSVS